MTSGDSDITYNLDLNTYKKIDSMQGVHASPQNVGQMLFMLINTKREPLAHAKVRKALMLSYPKKKITKHIYGKTLDPTDCYVPPASSNCVKSLQQSQNLDRAQELLNEAGYSDGFSVTMVTTEAWPARVDAGAIWAKELSKIN